MPNRHGGLWTLRHGLLPWHRRVIVTSLCARVPQDSPNPRGVMSSKASGEPSLMMSTSVLTALQNAVAAGRREVGAPGLGHQVGLASTEMQMRLEHSSLSAECDYMNDWWCLCLLTPPPISCAGLGPAGGACHYSAPAPGAGTL